MGNLTHFSFELELFTTVSIKAIPINPSRISGKSYPDFRGYLPETSNYVKPDNWITGHKKNFDKWPEVNFYKVNEDVLGTSPTCCLVEEWNDCQNLQYITQEDVERFLDFGWMM